MALAAAAQCAAPTTMTRIVVRLQGPQIKEGSFAALPKTMYRAGDSYARIEEAPDSRQGIQKLIIINEPNAWMINLIAKTGSHATNGAKDDNPHLPVVFDPSQRLKTLNHLEFGDEYGFFEDANAKRTSGPIINSQQTDAFVVTTETGVATLVTKANSHVPIRLSWKTKQGTYTYEYIAYEDLPFKRELFESPRGMRIREIPKDSGEEVGGR